MRLLFAGTPSPAVPTLDALIGAGHEIAAVLTRPDTRSGRGRSATRTEVGVRAGELGIPLLQPRTLRDLDVADQLRSLEVEAAAIVAYGALIPPAVLQIPTHGWINLHFSLLPRWRGAAPVQHAIAAGDRTTGVSTFLLEAGLDTGPVYRQRAVEVAEHATSGDLLEVLAEIGAEQMVATMADIAAGIAPTPQPAEGSTLAPKITVADAQVDFRVPARTVADLVRAVTPAPGAWCLIGDQRVKLGPVGVATDAQPLAPGVIEAGKHEVLVGTTTAPVRLGTVQPPGKRPMAAADYARGASIDAAVVAARETSS